MLNDFERLMFDRVSKTVGGNQKPFSYFKTEDSSTDILFCKDSPAQNYLTCLTLGLVNQKGKFQSNGKNVRVELLGLSTNELGDTLGKIMATLYKNIVEKNLTCAYGVIYNHVLDELLPNSDMKHILLTTPPLFWKESLGTINLDDDNILTWLYAMPISENEKNTIVDSGDGFKDAMVHLQEQFTLKNVDVFNLNRKSII
ncbi:MAG: suppressor of fused domain protein [Ruminococcus sp.]|nr:suppressor of fused domain protein [Ruminococcus sp.]MCD7799805.1 suppressor of fused domain protein [Ruminococcus sp.]